MPNLLDYTENTDAGHESALNEHRLKKEPSMTILFTQECEEAKLHYESDEAIRSYIQCPGDHCPLCYIGSTPNTFLLLPIYCIETGEVEVLRISQKRGPGTLLGGLRPYLKDPDITDKLLMISRINQPATSLYYYRSTMILWAILRRREYDGSAFSAWFCRRLAYPAAVCQCLCSDCCR